MTGKPERDAIAPTDETPADAVDETPPSSPPEAADSAGDHAVGLAEAEARAAENWDKYVRAVAELDNYRKRAARDIENAHKFGLERLARELLAVCDSLELGIAAGADAGAGVLLDGMQATLKLLNQTLEQFGVAEITALGQPFDPQYHEAMTLQPSAEVEPGSVLAVFQKGYTLNGRLLRAARVVVAQAPAATEPGA